MEFCCNAFINDIILRTFTEKVSIFQSISGRRANVVFKVFNISIFYRY